MSIYDDNRIIAVLGPTNTGKTHLAMERMLAHASGMIGFPLRLLARENYERAVKIKGAGQVALITGEEKIIPRHARYFMCTVEAMPIDREVAFLGVDEIQMCADPERGHVFTDRLLYARGSRETMFMGAETIRKQIRKLVPGVEYETRPRYSTLSWAGSKKLTRLPRRTAVVAFSAADVYSLAELLRRQRGGAAVVMGSLSPRTRNAQVEMYQNGEVDYLVATDAISMGLNMDVDHVAFAATRKFDGRQQRPLSPPELAQIAGRAGRHMNDGTFGVTGDIGPLDEEVIARIESHEFNPIKGVHWRNSDLRFTSVGDLRNSLAAPSLVQGLTRSRVADDEIILEKMSKEDEITKLASSPDRVRLLWDVCQIPDFRNVMSDAHAALLGSVYKRLTTSEGRISTDWLAGQVNTLERVDGDIETLVQRIAGVRTWTYIAYHNDWIEQADHWQERTRAIEDRLSDALHERLTQRFVDRKNALLVSRIKDSAELLAAVKLDGDVLVEGHYVGKLDGFRFSPEMSNEGEGDTAATKAVINAASRALREEINARVVRLEQDADGAFTLEKRGEGWGKTILWQGQAVARLTPGIHPGKPEIEPFASDLLDGTSKDRIRVRVSRWMTGWIAGPLAPLERLNKAKLEGAARGVAWQLIEEFGTLKRHSALEQIEALSKEQRWQLRKVGVKIAREAVYIPAMLKPATQAICGLLWGVFHKSSFPLPIPPAGRVSFALQDDTDTDFLEAIGYRPFGRLGLRIDMVERLAEMSWEYSKKAPFAITPDLLSIAGCSHDDMKVILEGLGYHGRLKGETTLFSRRPAKKKPVKGQRHQPAQRKKSVKKAPVDMDSPFAVLAGFKPGRKAS